MKLILIHLSYSGCPSSSVSTCVQHRKLLRRYITFILNKVQNKVQCILYCPSQSRQTTFQLLTCFIRPGAVILDSTDEENKTETRNYLVYCRASYPFLIHFHPTIRRQEESEAEKTYCDCEQTGGILSFIAIELLKSPGLRSEEAHV